MNDIIIILNQLKDIAFSVVNIKLIVIIVSSILGACLSLYVVWFAIKSLINSVKNGLKGNFFYFMFISDNGKMSKEIKNYCKDLNINYYKELKRHYSNYKYYKNK